MIAWRVLVGLGNGIMISMGPVLYSDVAYRGPELGGILASKIPGALTLWRHQNIIYGDARISITGSAADGGILVYIGLNLLKKIQALAPETLTTAQPAEDETHVQPELINTFQTHS